MQSLLTVYSLSDEGEENLLILLLHIFDLTMLPSIWKEMKFSISQEALGLCVLLCLFYSQLLCKITFWWVSLSVLKTTDYVSVKFKPFMWVLEIAQSLIIEHIPSKISLHSAKQLHSDNVALTFISLLIL